MAGNCYHIRHPVQIIHLFGLLLLKESLGGLKFENDEDIQLLAYPEVSTCRQQRLLC